VLPAECVCEITLPPSKQHKQSTQFAPTRSSRPTPTNTQTHTFEHVILR
jgi:hypothetical protein